MAATYPLPKFHFRVEWGGAKIGFSEVTGLTIEHDLIEYRDGSSPEYHKIKMPGLQKFSNLTLKRGTFQNDADYYKWINAIKLSNPERRDVSVSLLNENHEPVVVWKIKNAFPLKFQSADLKSDANEIAIESIELAHEGLTVEYL